jgi:hypothetical protein
MLPPPARPRTLRATISLALLTLPASSSLLAQDTTVSATMLRVLAEAADVHRTGQPIFLVADYRYPHHVIGRFSTQEEAKVMKADSGATFGVFGPFVTPADPVLAPGDQVVNVRVTTKSARGLRTVDFNPTEVDALFLSMSAIDKFAVPYYAKVYGAEYARRMRQRLSVARVMPHRLSVQDSGLVGRRLRVWDPTEPRPK